MARRTALGALLAALAACGPPAGKPVTPGELSLLRRGPDEVLASEGVLAVDRASRWGPHDRGGWSDAPGEHPDAGLFVWSANPSARLALPSGLARDRLLRLVAWAPEGEGPGELDLRLNGVALGTRPLGAEPAAIEIETPSVLWREGENVLELAVPDTVRTEDGERVGFALSRVEYDEPARVGLDLFDETLELPGGTGVRYRIECSGPAEVALAGRAGGAGELSLGLAAVDPATGAATPIEGASAAVASEGGRLDARLATPADPPALLELELLWRARGEARPALRLDRLRWTERAPPERPPILFVSVDTLAADNLGLHGYPRATTPRLEAFAKEAIVFENCRANAPRTLPSYVSQLSGLYPSASEPIDAEAADRWIPPIEQYQLAERRWTLAEMLRGAGYRTAAWVDNPWLMRGVGLSQGFDRFDASAAKIAHAPDPERSVEGGIAHILPLAKEWIGRLGERDPFFVLVQALDVHGPYFAVEPWRGTFDGDGLYDPDHRLPTARELSEHYGVIPRYVADAMADAPRAPPEMRTAPLANAYDEKVLEMDERLGRFFEELRASGVLDRSVVVVSADHGESLLDHDYYFGHGTLHGECLRVPLIVRLPGGAHGGTRVSEPVQLVDLYPTLAELAGVDLSGRGALHGRSLAPLLRGGGEPGPRPLLAAGGVAMGYALEHDGWKLIRTHPDRAGYPTKVTHPLAREWIAEVAPELVEREPTRPELREFFRAHPEIDRELHERLRGPIHELYDVRSDPGETRDLAEAEPERARAMAELLDRELERARSARLDLDAVAGVRRLDDDATDELRALGYLDDAAPESDA